MSQIPTVQTYGIRRARGVTRPSPVRPFVAGAVAAAVAVVGVGVLGAGWLDNPFSTATVDHSPPPVLTELRDLADFHAAQARFEVIVDHEDDVNLVPQFLAGERVQFVAVGSVDAIVDFTGIDASSVEVGDDGRSVTVTVPAPYLAAPAIEHDLSHVMNRDRGLLDRVGGALVDSPTGERELLLAAEAKMATAAGATDLLDRAEANTTAMLDGMLGALGYDIVTVRYAPVASPG